MFIWWYVLRLTSLNGLNSGSFLRSLRALGKKTTDRQVHYLDRALRVLQIAALLKELKSSGFSWLW